MTMARLWLVRSISAPAGVWAIRPGDARDGHDQAGGRLVPALVRPAHGDQVDREVGSEAVAYVGEEEIEGVEAA